MRKRRFGIFSRHELSAASFALMEAITDELLREYLRCPQKDVDAMCDYLVDKKVEERAITGIYENMTISVPRLLGVIRACADTASAEQIAKEQQVILPFVEACMEMRSHQMDMEPKRSLKEGYYY